MFPIGACSCPVSTSGFEAIYTLGTETGNLAADALEHFESSTVSLSPFSTYRISAKFLFNATSSMDWVCFPGLSAFCHLLRADYVYPGDRTGYYISGAFELIDSASPLISASDSDAIVPDGSLYSAFPFEDELGIYFGISHTAISDADSMFNHARNMLVKYNSGPELLGWAALRVSELVVESVLGSDFLCSPVVSLTAKGKVCDSLSTKLHLVAEKALGWNSDPDEDDPVNNGAYLPMMTKAPALVGLETFHHHSPTYDGHILPSGLPASWFGYSPATAASLVRPAGIWVKLETDL